MLALRILAEVLAAALLGWAIWRYRSRRITRLNLILSGVLAVGLALLAGVPSLFDPLFEAFDFERGGGERLTAVLILGNLILLLLVVSNRGQTDVVRRDLKTMFEWIGTQSFDEAQAETLPSGERIVVALPAYNEAENVGGVIRAMPQKIEGHVVVPLVVDDASEDGTVEAARAAGALVARLPIRRGGGQAVRIGYEIALRLDADVVATMDADGQHVPEELTRLVEPILRGEADMVQGSRMLGTFEKESRVRHLGVLFFSGLMSLLTGVRLTDVSNGYRATRADVLRRFVLEQDQFWTSEIIIEAIRHRTRVKEVPITVRARTGGVSKKPRPFKYGWNFLKVIVKTWLR